jgi:hypothetical protein
MQDQAKLVAAAMKQKIAAIPVAQLRRIEATLAQADRPWNAVPASTAGATELRTKSFLIFD